MLWSFAPAETPTSFIHRKAKSTGHSEVFEVQVRTIYYVFTAFLRSVRQKPWHIVAMFLRCPWPKTLLFMVFLNTILKKTVICNVFAAAVAENTAIGKADRQAD